MILDFKARGGGYFRVYVRNEEYLSQHSDEREATQQCANAYFADPTCAPYYRHEGPERGSRYVVDLIVTNPNGAIVLPPPPPQPPPVETTGAVDVLEKIASMVPAPTHEINAATFEAALPIFAARHTDWLVHALKYDGKLAASCWRGFVVVYRWAHVRLLAKGVG